MDSLWREFILNSEREFCFIYSDFCEFLHKVTWKLALNFYIVSNFVYTIAMDVPVWWNSVFSSQEPENWSLDFDINTYDVL